MEKKIFVAKKMDFGTRAMCEARLKKITAAFCDDCLKSYGLERDAKTFDDFTRGGTKSIAKYRASLEAELNVNSKIPFIARKAQHRNKLSKPLAAPALDFACLGLQAHAVL